LIARSPDRRHEPDRRLFHFDTEFPGRVANRIVNEVRGINRMHVTSKPAGTIEWE
jgi:GMP synthase (glutamine-hydrolysing)